MLFPYISSQKEKKEHMQRYSKRFFAKKLLDHGFVSYQNEGLSWYKVVNGEVLLSVYLFTALSFEPLLPYIGFGMTPLFIEAPIPQDVHIQGLYNDELMTVVSMDPPRHQVAEDIWVQSTCSEERGAEKLDQVVFPIIDPIQSISDVYNFYKTRYFERSRFKHEVGMGDNIQVSDHFVDMAIYLNDREMYPYCQDRIEKMLKRKLSGKYWKESDVARTKLRHLAVVEGQRDIYLLELEKRKNAFEVLLKNKVGI